MSTQGGDASREKIGHLPDPFVPEKNVMKRIETKNEYVPADQAIVPGELLSCVWMKVLCGFQENCADVGGAVFLGLHVHGLCKVSNKKPGRSSAHVPHGLHHQVPSSPHRQLLDRPDHRPQCWWAQALWPCLPRARGKLGGCSEKDLQLQYCSVCVSGPWHCRDRSVW